MLRQAFYEELLDLRADLYHMGEDVLLQLSRTKRAFQQQDKALARMVITTDQNLNTQELALEEKSLELIALQQPVSADLRQVIAVLKASSDLERMGDHLRAVAQAILRLSTTEPLETLSEPINALFLTLGQLVKHSFEAYRNQNSDQAIAISTLDDRVDDLYQTSLNQLTSYLVQYPDRIVVGKDYLEILLHLERLGDYAKNVCEWVVYLEIGKIVHL